VFMVGLIPSLFQYTRAIVDKDDAAQAYQRPSLHLVHETIRV